MGGLRGSEEKKVVHLPGTVLNHDEDALSLFSSSFL
jgi:hypothetical protein